MFEILQGKPLPLSMIAFQCMKTRISDIYKASHETFNMLKQQEDDQDKIFQCLELAFQNLDSRD